VRADGQPPSHSLQEERINLCEQREAPSHSLQVERLVLCMQFLFLLFAAAAACLHPRPQKPLCFFEPFVLYSISHVLHLRSFVFTLSAVLGGGGCSVVNGVGDGDMESEASKPSELPGSSLRGSSTMVMKAPWLQHGRKPGARQVP
jgi:hypothetical protein